MDSVGSSKTFLSVFERKQLGKQATGLRSCWTKVYSNEKDSHVFWLRLACSVTEVSKPPHGNKLLHGRKGVASEE